MTIPTPTNNPTEAVPQGLPGGLPEAAALARLANDFFAAWPGAASTGMSQLPVDSGLGAAVPDPGSFATNYIGGVPGANLVPSSPHQGIALAATAPQVLPHAQTQNGLPDNVATNLPAKGRVGGIALGVPEAYAAHLPTPALSSADPSVHAGAPQPEDWGLPGETELKALLIESDAAPHASLPNGASITPAPTTSTTATPYYFVDTVPSVPQSGYPPFDVNAIRRDFPILSERVNGRPLIWFDNAATTQKPSAVIERLKYFYEHENSNIHRAAHELAARATDAYEGARDKVAKFLGASSSEEIIFVRGATEAINLVAHSWGRKNLNEGDEIVLSHLEHHANIVPWQQIASEKGAKIRVIPVDDSGQVLLEEYRKLLNDRTKIVAITQVSNALGTVVPVKEIVELAHRAGAVALVDGAQSVSHMRVNVQDIGADFFVFSGHKIFAPTGIGVVYGKKELLEDMPPYQGGGNMIQDVTFERTLYHGPPARFEAGTGNIADAVGLGAAIDYVERIGLENIARYEHDLLEYATHGIRNLPGLRLIGTAQNKASVLSFVLDGYSTEEVGKALNAEGIAVRSGHHCAQPILRRFGLEATVRPSLAFYNTCEEVDCFVAVVRRLAGQRRAAA